MITYIKMKRKEHKIKLAVYTAVESFINEKEDIAKLVADLYKSMKDTSVDELQSKFINALAEIVASKNNTGK